MMYGTFGGMWFTGIAMMVLFWVAIILVVVWVVRSLFPHQMRSGHEPALEILQQRYAAGEISEAEYERARAQLEEIPAAPFRAPTEHLH